MKIVIEGAALKLEKMPTRCSNCQFQKVSRTEKEVTFGCVLNDSFLYDTIEGQMFDRHPQCPLQPIELDNNVEEALKMFDDVLLDNVENYVPTLERENMVHFKNTIKNALRDKNKLISQLKSSQISVGELVEQSTLESFYNQECTKNCKLQSKLDKIAEVVYEDETVNGEIEHKLEQILKEETK